MSNNSIESQSPLSRILAGPCFANKLTVLLWVFRNRLTPCVYRHPVNTTHLYDFVQCWTNFKDVGPTLYKCYTNVLCLLGRRTFSQTLYICAMLVQCWASVADVGLTLKQRWVSVRWSSIQSYKQVTSSTTLYCILKAYTHASLEPDSIFNPEEQDGCLRKVIAPDDTWKCCVRISSWLDKTQGEIASYKNVPRIISLKFRWKINIFGHSPSITTYFKSKVSLLFTI